MESIESMEPQIRKMTLQDVPAICMIEREAFATPWSEEAFIHELTQNHFACYLVMETGNQIVGYGGMWMVMNEAHITNIAITEAYRGRKWGEKLLDRLQQIAKDYGCSGMTLEVRVSNEIAQQLYRKFGFREEGIRKRYYSDNQEDALIMWADL
ncbi:ribosomal protein S18-alanine N-acetyltransferase [Marinicrinis sediminis]|uniref:[Ribosomal protein bS18]-alanine N-acetyltransferase n=1 Tax=Marinicrinis sediminis TaxID=1652465 RepID=A0ABW5R7X0_9BACL